MHNGGGSFVVWRPKYGKNTNIRASTLRISYNLIFLFLLLFFLLFLFFYFFFIFFLYLPYYSSSSSFFSSSFSLSPALLSLFPPLLSSSSFSSLPFSHLSPQSSPLFFFLFLSISFTSSS
jgi:hypothetical protein